MTDDKTEPVTPVVDMEFDNAPVATAALAALREQPALDMNVVRDALRVVRETGAHHISSEVLAAVNASGLKTSTQILRGALKDAGLKTTAEVLRDMVDASDLKPSSLTVLVGSMKTISDAHASSALLALHSVDVAPGWNESVRQTLEAITRSAVVVPESVRQSIADIDFSYPTLPAANAFRAALAEAATTATREEEARPRADAPVRLTDEQARQLETALLGVMAALASSVATFVGSKEFEKAISLFQLLVAVVVLTPMTDSGTKIAVMHLAAIDWQKWSAIGTIIAAGATVLLAWVTWRLVRATKAIVAAEAAETSATKQLAEAPRVHGRTSALALAVQAEPRISPSMKSHLRLLTPRTSGRRR